MLLCSAEIFLSGSLVIGAAIDDIPVGSADREFAPASFLCLSHCISTAPKARIFVLAPKLPLRRP